MDRRGCLCNMKIMLNCERFGIFMPSDHHAAAPHSPALPWGRLARSLSPPKRRIMASSLGSPAAGSITAQRSYVHSNSKLERIFLISSNFQRCPYAAAAMQGWRRGMEDAHVATCVPEGKGTMLPDGTLELHFLKK